MGWKDNGMQVANSPNGEKGSSMVTGSSAGRGSQQEMDANKTK